MKPISLGAELIQALLGAVIAGLGTFAGTLTAATLSDLRALEAAGIAAGFVGLTFFSNSLRAWYAQQGGSTPAPAPIVAASVPAAPAGPAHAA